MEVQSRLLAQQLRQQCPSEIVSMLYEPCRGQEATFQTKLTRYGVHTYITDTQILLLMCHRQGVFYFNYREHSLIMATLECSDM
jgi:hypothetical protein